MSGVKGKSGRKPLLAHETVEEILKVSSEILLRWLSNKEVKDEKKIQVVSQLVGKRIPSTVEAEHTFDDETIGLLNKALTRLTNA